MIMKIQFVVAAVFGLVAGLIVWKLPAFVSAAFVIASIGAGYFVAKNNKNVADKFK